MKWIFRINSGVLFLVILLPTFFSEVTASFTLWGFVLTMSIYSIWLYCIAFFGAQQLKEDQKVKVNLPYLRIAMLTVLAMIILRHFIPESTGAWHVLRQVGGVVVILLWVHIAFIVGRTLLLLEYGNDIAISDYFFTTVWIY